MRVSSRPEATNLLFAICEAGVDNEAGASSRFRIVRFARLGGGRAAIGGPQRTIASHVPDAIDLAIGLATERPSRARSGPSRRRTAGSSPMRSRGSWSTG